MCLRLSASADIGGYNKKKKKRFPLPNPSILLAICGAPDVWACAHKKKLDQFRTMPPIPYSPKKSVASVENFKKN
jgi:hypothetical protein